MAGGVRMLRLENFRRHANTELALAGDAQVILISGENGAGKCLPGHVRVHDPDAGESVPIERFVAERRKRVLGVVDGTVTPVDVTDWHTLGAKPAVELQLATGVRMQMAGTHPVLTDRGCVRAAELAPGDWVAEVRVLPATGPVRLSVDEALLAGLLLGAGSVSGKAVTFRADDPATAGSFDAALRRVFPNLRVSRRAQTSHYRVASAWSAAERRSHIGALHAELVAAGVPLERYLRPAALRRFAAGDAAPGFRPLGRIADDFGLDLHDVSCGLHAGRAVHRWASDLGLDGPVRAERVPPTLLHLPPEQTRALLTGLWQTAGGFDPAGRAVFDSGSAQLCQDVRLLLLRLGLLSSIGGSAEAGYRTRVSAGSSWPFGELPLVGDQAARRDRALTTLLATTPDQSWDLLPATRPAASSSPAAGGTPEGADSDLRWVRVCDVVATAEVECFDLTVDSPEHLYVAETLVVHNSTLLESIHYALWGEHRNGNRNLDELVRWGHELEGMQVECEFVVGNTTYRVVRRRDNKASSAQLFANDQLIVQGAREVTREISKVFGMDAVGFRLAVLAQQDQLDGLASLRAAERADTVSRLLRLDVIGVAAEAARKVLRTEREVAKVLGAGEDLERLRAARETISGQLAAARVALEESNAAAALLDAELAASEAVEQAWLKAQNDMARAEGTLGAARAELDRLTAELSGLVIPVPVQAPPQTLEQLQLEVTEVERALARGEAAEEIAAQRHAVERELAGVLDKLTALDAEVAAAGGHDGAAEAESTAAGRVAAAEAAQTAATAAAAELRERWHAVKARVEHLTARVAATADLGAVCDRCGQDVSDEHRHRQTDELAAALADAQAQLHELTGASAAAETAVETAAAETASGAAALAAARDLLARLTRLARDREDLERRRRTYASQLDRLSTEPADMESLYARKAELAIATTLARQAAEQARMRTVMLERQAGLEQAAAAASARVAAAEQAHAAASPDADLAAAYARRQELKDARTAERETSAECAKLVAVTEQQLVNATGQVERVEEALRRRREHEQKAVDASVTAEVLDLIERRLATEIRPALEGQLCELLDRLSEGRFSKARIDKDYAVSVETDGQFRALKDFSGGEQKLIALAMRLALAEVVSARHGAGGAGFLILDEVFGSQDTGRRESIVAGLRNLRDKYGQIFLISHVGGLEDDADLVLDVCPDGDERVATVTAG